MVCITSIRFNLIATVVRNGQSDNFVQPPTSPTEGHYENYQDPITGEVERVWVNPTIVPVTPVLPRDEKRFDIKISAAGFNDTGYRSPANLEIYTDETLNVFELIQIRYSARHILTRDDKITNIRTLKGNTVWMEEEMPTEGGTFIPTTFDIKGITPQIDPFGRHTENMAILRRMQVQV